VTLGAGVKAIVFDFDGVILESLDVKTEAFRQLFADHPAGIADRVVKLHTENMGVSRYEKFKTIYRDFLDEPLDDAEMQRLGERFSALVFDGVVACDFVNGAPEFLERMAHDHQLYVASATPEEELQQIVEARGITRHFQEVAGTPRTKAEVVCEVLEAERLRPDEVLFVGDAITDYRGAAQHNARFVGRVPPGAGSPFADLDVPTVADLAELDQRWD
jgi:HAD superfamily hydrolase (TIGR01549 family)